MHARTKCREALYMKHTPLYLITKSQQHVHTESITDEPPSRVVFLPSLIQIVYIFRCIAGICLSVTMQNLFVFHSVHFESFHIEYLAVLAFLQLLLHWVDGGELCLTEQPLALLQSWSLTAVFFHLHLFLTPFHIFRFLHMNEQNHTGIQMLTCSTSYSNCVSFVDLPPIHNCHFQKYRTQNIDS